MSSHASILYKIAILFVCEIIRACNKLLQYFPLVCYFKIQFIASCLLDKLSKKSKKMSDSNNNSIMEADTTEEEEEEQYSDEGFEPIDLSTR